MELIAETAYHHQGDSNFMFRLVNQIIENSQADIVKMHITLDIDEYMNYDHEFYDLLKSYTLGEKEWIKLIELVGTSDKKLMLLLNDTKAIEFATQFNPALVEIHSVAINNYFLLDKLQSNINSDTQVVFGVGGCDIAEIDYATTGFENVVLMFGFQNYPTKYQDINLIKMRRLMQLFRGYSFGYADHTAWDESNNELITLLCAANSMDYIEKHVTTHYGQERTDYSAAISIKMFNQLADKIRVLERISGSGKLDLSVGEKDYSLRGPMKMTALSKRDISNGSIVNLEDIKFQRTKQESDLSQKDMLEKIGKRIKKDIFSGEVFLQSHF